MAAADVGVDGAVTLLLQNGILMLSHILTNSRNGRFVCLAMDFNGRVSSALHGAHAQRN